MSTDSAERSAQPVLPFIHLIGSYLFFNAASPPKSGNLFDYCVYHFGYHSKCACVFFTCLHLLLWPILTSQIRSVASDWVMDLVSVGFNKMEVGDMKLLASRFNWVSSNLGDLHNLPQRIEKDQCRAFPAISCAYKEKNASTAFAA